MPIQQFFSAIPWRVIYSYPFITSVELQIGAVVVVIVWLLDLQLPVQSWPISSKVVNSNSVHGEAYSIQHLGIKFVSDLRQISGFLHQ